MPRPKKDSKALNVMIDNKIYQLLEQYSSDSKLTKTAVVELALEEYLKKNTK
ncbi:hypothetical protein H5983_06085 [Faecalitalea cylindroides]|uniref:RepB family protein n=1 Tax=Faecalitalea cylindroides TaxID=39483 RepID=UPI00195AA1F8|nr:RepB family protein [Faecalitalea cylindroides]MBM6810632.1 hypothetical protein [Faecalitalea cylindroides]